MNINEQNKLSILYEIENLLTDTLQKFVVFSLDPNPASRQTMSGFFARVKDLAIANQWRELGYICMKNEEFLKQDQIDFATDNGSLIKLSKGFGELTLALKKLMRLFQENEKLVCDLKTPVLDTLSNQNDEISNLALGRVLVLDDEMLVLNIIESVLRNRGYDVRISSDADQAMEILRAREADILILDLVMPGKSGIDFYRDLKREKIVIPTIVLTASANKDDHVLALREGIDNFLRKPFEAEVLVANVQKLITKENKQKSALLRDALTMAYTRSYFAIRFAEEKARFLRDRRVFSVVFIDIDHFKEINDTYGHAFGDEVLKCFVAEFKGSFRPGDQISRYGGDEFLLLLPETDVLEAFKVVERIRQKFQRKAFNDPISSHQIHITFSAGISEFDDNDKTLEMILEEADRQLYRSKERGRACTSYLQDEIDSWTEKNRVLICDDSTTMSRLISSRLSRLGLETREVSSGSEVLAVFPDFKPHLLILDMILPDLDGATVLKEIRDMEPKRQVKVILISVKGLAKKEAMLRKLGYDDYIKKPISLERLEQSVKRLL
jgi:diguanylate cyclase (GGDEF)-like protein